MKSCLSSNPNFNISERIVLQGEDRLWFLYYHGQTLGDVSWSHLQIPHEYLTDNWPVRFVSLSRSGEYIAIAGRRGIAVYNTLGKRWQLFGNRNQEQAISTRGLAWFEDIVIVVNFNQAKGRHELLFYPRKTLRKAALLHLEPLPRGRVPQVIDCNQTDLVIFTTDCFFYQVPTNPYPAVPPRVQRGR